jgi:hypothetical protein
MDPSSINLPDLHCHPRTWSALPRRRDGPIIGAGAAVADIGAGRGKEEVRRFKAGYTVFNAEQCDGLPALHVGQDKGSAAVPAFREPP